MSNDNALIVREEVAEGSVTDLAIGTGTRLVNVLFDIDGIVLLDVSSSMMTPDAMLRERQTNRHTKARDELRRLQKDNPGKIALLCYSDYVQFCPSGIPVEQNGMTAMTAAIEYVREFAGTGIHVTLISDGEPTDSSSIEMSPEESVLRAARNFGAPIHTIFAGGEGDHRARELMRKIAEASGGLTEADGVADIYNPVSKILLAAPTQE